ncbi:mandelate racemase/muconate lactonizing enzyme family protein [Agrococcus terreus]|uniref:L-rhamnonate dehydratase n=1 Tax=Agrococcus terreus TaxID=574649 RepID=A0ABQ2KNR0_9MICO|nr:mandelate racemase/muconate lactonizing enzyme family protein [Agrococcus terreus]GGN88559.1 L-rhamnonate dehydratase [Agrococcus terreus]
MTTRLERARVTLLRAPSRLASSEITAPMDRIPAHRGRRASWYGSMDAVLVELAVDGLDDAAPVGLAVTQGGSAVAALLADHLLPLALGSPLRGVADVEALWERLRLATLPYGSDGLAAMARSAIDIAAWDLLGRVAEQPLVRLLGGEARRLPAYATGNDIEHHRALGLRTSKIGLRAGPWHDDGLADAIRQVEEAREAAGDDHGLMVDGWMGLDAPFAVALAPALRAARMQWLEEPLPPDDLDGLVAVARALGDVPLATGEHATSIPALLALPPAGVRVLQPDLAWCGGITAVRRLHDALPAGVELAPHLSGSPWGVHVAAALPSVRRVEWYVESAPDEPIDAVDGPLRGGPVPLAGEIGPGEAPGLGVAVDRAHVERWAVRTVDVAATRDARSASLHAD